MSSKAWQQANSLQTSLQKKELVDDPGCLDNGRPITGATAPTGSIQPQLQPQSYGGEIGAYHSPFHDELIARIQSSDSREHTQQLLQYLSRLSPSQFKQRQDAVLPAIRRAGLTETTILNNPAHDSDWQMDLLPRLIDATEWNHIERGLLQRSKALELLIQDLKRDRCIVKDEVLPKFLVQHFSNYFRQFDTRRTTDRQDSFCFSSDLIRDQSGQVRVFADQPDFAGGVSYLLENRRLMKKLAPDFFEQTAVLPVEQFAEQLNTFLKGCSPNSTTHTVMLAAGSEHPQYSEHLQLARSLGITLVECNDLHVSTEDGFVYCEELYGNKRVDVIFHVLAECQLDPGFYKRSSRDGLGVDGLIAAWQQGRVAITNSPGSELINDKALFPFIPTLVKYYLDEPLLLENTETYSCADDHSLAYVLDNIDELVIKSVKRENFVPHFIAAESTAERKRQFLRHLNEYPADFIAQALTDITTYPIINERGLSPQHLLLRTFTVQGDSSFTALGGLTLTHSSSSDLIAETADFTGSKDTWVIASC